MNVDFVLKEEDVHVNMSRVVVLMQILHSEFILKWRATI